MGTEPIENAYFNWLCTKVAKAVIPTPSLTYYHLLRQLQQTEFSWILQMDDNRAEDGVELRYDFLREAFLEQDDNFLMFPCSIFEMIYALCKNAAFETDQSATWWFWTILENLGLSEFNDASGFNPDRVAGILHRLVWRQYDDLGHGGMFPLKSSPHDQREVEIWYQFCEYLVDPA